MSATLKKLLAALFVLGIAGEARAQIGFEPPAGTSGTPPPSSSIEPGVTPVTGAASCFMYADTASFAQCAATFLAVDDAGAGDGALVVRKTPTGGSATSNFLSFTGTQPATLTANFGGVRIQIAGAGSSAFTSSPLRVTHAAGYSGGSSTFGAVFAQANAGTATWATSFTALTGNSAVYATSNPVTTGTNIGAAGTAANGDVNIGQWGYALGTKNGATMIGVLGIANNAGTTPNRVGGFFGLMASAPSVTDAALMADNGAIAAPAAVFRDNGTAVFQVPDNGGLQTSPASQLGAIVIGPMTTPANNSGGATGNILIGAGAVAAGVGTNNIAIGTGAATPGPGAGQISIGNTAGVSNNGNNSSIAIGNGASASGGITLGAGSVGGNAPSITMGTSVLGAQNAFVAGGGINAVYFGQGITSTIAATNGSVTINGTGGSGLNNAGGELVIAPGRSTGNATPAFVRIKSTTAGGSSSTAQTLNDAITVGPGGATTISGATSIAGATTFTSGGTRIAVGVAYHYLGDSASTAWARLGHAPVLTPDGPVFQTGSESNTLRFYEQTDAASDFGNGLAGTSPAASPAFIIHGPTPNQTEYSHHNFYGTGGGNQTTLVDNVATAVMHTPTLSANGQRYQGDGSISVYVTDAAGEVQAQTLLFTFDAFRANTGGTACAVETGVSNSLPPSSGTLSATVDCSVASDVVTFTMTADTSLTPTTFIARSRFNCLSCTAELIPD